MNEKKFDSRAIVLIGLLTAMEVVLSRFLSISVWNMKIGFSFLPVAVAAMLLGPLGGGLVGGLGDFLGAILFPSGPFFPGFTLTMALSGVILGCFLRRRRTLPQIVGAVVTNQVLMSLLLNSLWISILNRAPYGAVVAVRLIQCGVMIPVQIVTIGLLARSLEQYLRRQTA